jgi:hypothetical protein
LARLLIVSALLLLVALVLHRHLETLSVVIKRISMWALAVPITT